MQQCKQCCKNLNNKNLRSPLLLSSIACNAEGRNLFPAASAAARTDVRSPLLLSSIAILIQLGIYILLCTAQQHIGQLQQCCRTPDGCTAAYGSRISKSSIIIIIQLDIYILLCTAQQRTAAAMLQDFCKNLLCQIFFLLP
jgi:hypothetical protein